MATQAERREKTRTALVTTAISVFGVQGYAQTTMEEVAIGAGVAKGALYHHFSTKRDLFEAVLRQVSGQVAAEVAGAIVQPSGTPDADTLFAMMRTGVGVFFKLSAQSAITQIMLKDGPAALGWERWREIDTEHFGGLVTALLSQGMASGALRPQPVEPLSRLLVGAICEAALYCSTQESFADAAVDYVAALENLIFGLRAD